MNLYAFTGNDSLQSFFKTLGSIVSNYWRKPTDLFKFVISFELTDILAKVTLLLRKLFVTYMGRRKMSVKFVVKSSKSSTRRKEKSRTCHCNHCAECCARGLACKHQR